MFAMCAGTFMIQKMAIPIMGFRPGFRLPTCLVTGFARTVALAKASFPRSENKATKLKEIVG